MNCYRVAAVAWTPAVIILHTSNNTILYYGLYRPNARERGGGGERGRWGSKCTVRRPYFVVKEEETDEQCVDISSEEREIEDHGTGDAEQQRHKRIEQKLHSTKAKKQHA